MKPEPEQGMNLDDIEARMAEMEAEIQEKEARAREKAQKAVEMAKKAEAKRVSRETEKKRAEDAKVTVPDPMQAPPEPPPERHGVEAPGRGKAPIPLPASAVRPKKAPKVKDATPPTIPTPEKAPAPKKPAKKTKAALKMDVAITSEEFSGTRIGASEAEVIRWVFNNMDMVGIRGEDAPCPGAWSLLKICREDPSIKKDFYRTIWPKLLPNKTSAEVDAAFTDDGREQFDLITRMKKSMEAAG